MKKILIAAFWFLATSVVHADDPDKHGMLVFGNSKIYLSHLPMFHPHHRYQVIFEAEFPDSVATIYRDSLTAFPKQPVYTVDPELFVLPDKVELVKARENDPTRPVVSFQAKLWRGHFERSGKVELAKNLKVILKKVIFFERFEDGAEHPPASTYLFFGNLSEQFVAHWITAPPDFDHVLPVRAPQELVEQLKTSSTVKLTIPAQGAMLPLKNPGRVSVEFQKDQRPVKTELELKKQLYFEDGELEG